MIQKILQQQIDKPSDINQHLPTLKKYADECEHITEMGVRWISSSFAFLAANPKTLISIDLQHPTQCGSKGKTNWKTLNECVEQSTTDYTFIQANTHEIEIEETDLLFIDTGHHLDCIEKELELHGNKARKYLVFHDTETFRWKGDIPNSIGIWPAIEDFMINNEHWALKEHFTNNNGLTILERV